MMKRFLKITGIVIGSILLILIGVVIYGYYKIKSFKDTHDLQAHVDSMCNKYIDKGKTPGLWVGIVQGNNVYMQGYGFADNERRIKPDSSTIFEIGSITKVFTAEMAQLLAEQGQLNWSDDIRQYLPAEVKLPVQDSTTLQHLASHTSGFPRLPEMWFAKLDSNPCNPYSSLTVQDLYNYLNNSKDKKQASPKAYDYSNLGAGLLGHILEWKTGKTYEALLQEFICRPLGMTHTSVITTDTTVFAAPYDERGKRTCHWDFPVIYGCGAIKSTGADMVRFLAANMNNPAPLGKSFAKTQQQVAKIPGGGIGYGWHIDKMNGAFFGVDKIIWHNGGTGGFRTYMGFDPATNRGIVVLSNQANDALDELAIKLLIKTVKISLK